MVKPKGKKNKSSEPGPEASSAPASSAPDSEAPEADDSVDEPFNKTVLAAIGALSTQVNRIKSEVYATIENRITEVSATIKSEISSLNESVQKSISELRGKSVVHEVALKELEECASTHSDMLRNNIRIIGIPEGKEGPRPSDFIAQLLTEALSLPEQLLIDRAHRISRQKPKPKDPPATLHLKTALLPRS